MQRIEEAEPMPSPDFTLLIGTTKGAFLLAGGVDRSGWTLKGPLCDGWPINHVVSDPATGALWAGGGNDWRGAGVWRSSDGGETWQVTRLTKGERDVWAEADAEFAKLIGWTKQDLPFAEEFKQIWSLGYAHGRLFAGAKPATLLVSDDRGETWNRVQSLTDHPSSDNWQPGGAGLILHTIVSAPDDPKKLWIAISIGGVIATEDGGETWQRRNRLSDGPICVEHNPFDGPRDGETGHCVHNMVRAPGDDDILYQQNHHGVWRSGDGGRSWDDITGGLPSSFGFPIRVHPRDPNTIWTLPLNGDSEGRYPPDAAAAIWRSRNGGQSWQALRDGLPQDNCFFTVLRQAMAVDTVDPAGLYFGTNTGSIYASLDEGERWEEIARHLPTVLSVEVMEISTES